MPTIVQMEKVSRPVIKVKIEELVAELAPRPDAPTVIRKLPDRAVPLPASRIIPMFNHYAGNWYPYQDAKGNKPGLIVIHWATDAPSGGMGQLHPENSEMMMDWIGAVYYWVKKGKDPKSSWTWKFPGSRFP